MARVSTNFNNNVLPAILKKKKVKKARFIFDTLAEVVNRSMPVALK